MSKNIFIVPENKKTLEEHLFKFQVEYPLTRLIRYDSMLVYSPKGDSNDKFLELANDIINKFNLNLVAELGTLILGNTIIIKERINADS